VLGALIVLYLSAVALRDWYWPVFGVPGVEGLPFNDLRFWTTAWECVRDGKDVVPVNVCDPQMRLMDHPRIWLAPADLGLGEGSTFVLGVTIALAFFLSVYTVIGEISPFDALLYAAVLCSPSVMLGIERANPDLIVFAVLVLALVLLSRRGASAKTIGHGFLFLAAVLKLYPVLAWGVLVRRREKAALLGLAALALLFALYAFATRDHLETIRSNLPRELRFSYGASVLADGTGAPLPEGQRGQILVVATGCFLAALLAVLSYRRSTATANSAQTNLPAAERDLDAFWAGAGIYVGTFALTYNFNYRLIFLILTVPQLLQWSKQRHPLVPWPRIALTVMLITLWFGTSLSFYPFGLGARWERLAADFPYDELANLLLFSYLLAAMLVTLLVQPVRRYSSAAGT
jgi:Glycosyltransferase family 87